MAGRTKLVAFRVTAEQHKQVTAQAAARGVSPGAFAREVLAERLARADHEQRGLPELHSQLKALRSDVALATRAILTVMSDPVTPQKAEEWVRRNLNR